MKTLLTPSKAKASPGAFAIRCFTLFNHRIWIMLVHQVLGFGWNRSCIMVYLPDHPCHLVQFQDVSSAMLSCRLRQELSGSRTTRPIGLYVYYWILLMMVKLVNWRPDGEIRGKRIRRLGKGGESAVAKSSLQGGSPRLCRLRTEPQLAPLSKYRTY